MTNDKCVVDTVAWIALINKADAMHTQTTAAYQDRFEMGQRLITTTAVLNETANALSAPRFRSAVVTLHNRLTQSQ